MRPALCVAVLLLGATAFVRADDEGPIPLNQLPRAVVAALKKRFPKAELKSASREKEGNQVVFEVSLSKDERDIDVTVTEAGVLILIEQELELKELPRAVAATLETRYPKAMYEVIQSVTKVENGKERLDSYEATLVSAGIKWDVEVLPDGKFRAAAEIKAK
jgi:hypothetical protein